MFFIRFYDIHYLPLATAPALIIINGEGVIICFPGRRGTVLDITILADSRPKGGIVRAVYMDGQVSIGDGHLPVPFRTPPAVRTAVTRSPLGGRLIYGGAVYRWYSRRFAG